MNNISSILTFHNTKYPEGLMEESVTGGVVTHKFDKEKFGVLELSIPKENVSPSVYRRGGVDKGVNRVCRRSGVADVAEALKSQTCREDDAGIERVCRRGGVADGTEMRNSGVADERVWDIVFSIDNSGSMSDICSDKKSKLDHIKHTISNILRIFSINSCVEENELQPLETKEFVGEAESKTNPICETLKSTKETKEFNVYIQTFNIEIKEIFDFTKVNTENVEYLIKKIDKIFAENCTNLRLPLEKSMKKIKERQKKYPTHNFIHIELTDGNDTCNNNIFKLNEKLCNDYKNIFIGFGKDHDSFILNTLANNNKNEYRFIDKLESAGLVYGEIVHDILYMKYQDVEINIKNGKIYNWRTNEWVNSLKIGSLSSGLEKSFHIKSTTPYLVEGVILDVVGEAESQTKEFSASALSSTNNIIIDEFSTLPDLIIEEKVFRRSGVEDEEEIERFLEIIDHTKYLYRQRTLELLFESKLYFVGEVESTKKTQPRRETLESKTKEFKNKLKLFFEIMKKYMKENNMEDDIFWKVLLDDIYIAYKTFGTRYSYLYTNSRQNTQGKQQTYTVNNLEDLEDLEFENNSNNGFDDDEYSTEGSMNKNNLIHEMLDNTQTSYSTPELLDLMKTINNL